MSAMEMLMTSRSFDEYCAMFAVDDRDLDGIILDCGGGASSFVARARALGVRALAADPLYARSIGVLADRLPIDLEQGHALISANTDRFVWEWYGSAERHREIRLRAGAEFIADMRRQPDSYLAACLPHLPLADDSVDMVLCSHLLFTWMERFDRGWHRAAIMEMSRICRGEVRIFPLVRLGDGEPVPFLDALREDLRAEGLVCEVREVPYEFQRGANHILAVKRHERPTNWA